MRLVYGILVSAVLQVISVRGSIAPAAEFPFKLRDGFIWVEVNISTSPGTLNFLLDSGAQVSVINSNTAQRLRIGGGRTVSVIGVGNTTKGLWPQKINARAGTIELPRDYLGLDLSQLSASCTNAAVDGIIGADFFQNRIVQVDYEHAVVRLLTESPPDTAAQKLPLKLRRCGMLVPVRVNDSKPEWVRLDTGCASALQWVTGSIRPEKCTHRMAVALSPFSLPVATTTLNLGDLQFEAVPTDLQQHEIFPGEKGLLGNGLLSRFKTVTIDTKRKALILGAVSANRPD